VSGPASPSRRRVRYFKREVQRALANGGMPRFLDALFGVGAWTYDPVEKLWIVPDRNASGPGREYYCIQITGDWFKARLSDEECS